MTGSAGAAPWWQGAVGYEVYLRSFADSDGDGVGDLRGLHDRLDHLAWLGVDIVWVTPFYPSPMHDHGYDVADYRGVDAVFGDLAELDRCIAKAHRLGLRFVIDLVPNHSSSDHPWFTAARRDRQDPYRDYYIWRDPAADGGPPNNWVSVFGGPAWTFDEVTGQYWLHLFLPEQPDLNWANSAVRDEFDDILRFWLERGVDGFRVDVAHALVKHPDLPDQPPAVSTGDLETGTSASDWHTLEHVYDRDQPGVLDVYRRWRPIADAYDAVLLAEAYLLEPDKLDRYVAGGDGMHLAFWFKPLHVRWSPEDITAALRDGASLPPGSAVWVQGSHDRHRAATRYGGGALGQRRQLVMATLQAGLPGPMFVYQGEELGLEDGVLQPGDAQDPIALHEGDVQRGRDACRTPMPWQPGAAMGFTTAARPWLPLGGRSDADTVAVQRDDPASMLHRYRRLVALRHDVLRMADVPVEWLPTPPGTVAYRRGAVVVVANLGDEPVVIAGHGSRDVAFAAGDAAVEGATLRLGGTSAAVITSR